MKRGEVWTVAGGQDCAGKPRPVVILQDDNFDETKSVTICPLTTATAEAPLARPGVEPTGHNGLQQLSKLMVDKITTVPRTKLGSRIGRLNEDDLVRLNRAAVVFLGLAASPRSGRLTGDAS